ncbi:MULTISPECIES: PA0069 family radical SAM protein [Burkholderia]|uniref:Radical SAM protein n=1 Tax=Burkholderia contaminans TaxID=488447 RepID=A0A2S5DZK7_9BURK|nr:MULTISPECIES: PA0069 family radical SAM protein [Burkholderia]EKS9796337.1 PA0069 family radical SAM protein [Burkholderia cepacia]EKS9802971.1 PA0069 family radical SAM protein [Burkholderia cepacia]EKS9810455.1 PA0069 family radical SAM protein [Burkholderia cepacia]EKS9817620.1 PA0069 family radical SAM protein [Burkholderia cepacia]EKS9824553.1 PA0069 family radical SAM protein [Burkholderia cepacia]
MGGHMDDRSDNEFPIAPPVPRKGRGAVDNLQGRYEIAQREAVDDGWTHESDDTDFSAPLRTQVFEERAKSILTRNQSPDIPFSVSLNPYRGCEHGCIYCFARPTHSYLGLSPGLDFESRIYAKVNAAELLEREISRKRYVPEPIALGVNTDAYQPVERDLRITRSVIQVMHDRGLPFAAITKSSLIERDLDLLAPMAERGQVMAAVTITTLDADLARTLEPRAATPARRLRTIRALSEAGVPVGVSIAPMIPFVTEPDMERVLEACAEAGATHASYIILRLPWEVAPLFKNWLAAHFPDRAERVMNRVRDMRGGKDYDSEFSKRMKGEGIWADLLRQRFRQAVKRLGLNERTNGILDLSQFRGAPATAAPRVAVRSAAARSTQSRDDSQLNLF